MNLSDVLGLAGNGLLIAVLMLRWVPLRRPSLRTGLPAFLILWGLTLVPVAGLPAAGFVRGMIGDLSVTTVILLLVALVHRLGLAPVVRRESHLALMILVALAGILLYPMALGLSYFDPYALGYGSRVFAAALLGIALAAWYFRLYLVPVCISAAVLAYLAGLYETTNLWDYLLDPLVFIYALVRLGKTALHAGRVPAKGDCSPHEAR